MKKQHKSIFIYVVIQYLKLPGWIWVPDMSKKMVISLIFILTDNHYGLIVTLPL